MYKLAAGNSTIFAVLMLSLCPNYLHYHTIIIYTSTKQETRSRKEQRWADKSGGGCLAEIEKKRGWALTPSAWALTLTRPKGRVCAYPGVGA